MGGKSVFFQTNKNIPFFPPVAVKRMAGGKKVLCRFDSPNDLLIKPDQIISEIERMKAETYPIKAHNFALHPNYYTLVSQPSTDDLLFKMFDTTID